MKPVKIMTKSAPPPEHIAPSYEHLVPESYDAVTSVYIPGKGWMLIELTIEGDKVTKRKVSEPDMKMIIMDRQKIAQVKLWKKVSG